MGQKIVRCRECGKWTPMPWDTLGCPICLQENLRLANLELMKRYGIAVISHSHPRDLAPGGLPPLSREDKEWLKECHIVPW